VNPIYEKSVNKQLAKSGELPTFKAGSLPWGKFIGKKRILIGHKDNIYLRVQVMSTKNVVYIDRETGLKHTEKTVAPYLRKRKEAPNKPTVRNVNIKNILGISAFNQRYGSQVTAQTS
jgi:hypothetical protein